MTDEAQLLAAANDCVEVSYFSGLQPYLPIWQAMRDFTEQRRQTTALPDQLWWVQHSPVYTLGQAAQPEHLLMPRADIDCVRTDRGGQITYHGPGQWVAYVLMDLRRAGYYIKDYVQRLEQSVIDLLVELGLPDAQRKPGAPGIYLPWPRASFLPSKSEFTAPSLAKCAALGVKIRQGCAYHGIALNVAMNLFPFEGINPCGFAGLRSIDLASCGVILSLDEIATRWTRHLQRQLWPNAVLRVTQQATSPSDRPSH